MATSGLSEYFLPIVRNTLLVSIDLIIVGAAQPVRGGLRSNPPARDLCFVPGSSIRKNETIQRAFSLISRLEFRHEGNLASAPSSGASELFYQTKRFGEPEFGIQYVALGYRIDLDRQPKIVPYDRDRTVRWVTAADISGAPDVHDNMKAYFR